MHFLIGCAIIIGLIYWAIIDEVFRAAIFIFLGIVALLIFLIVRNLH